LEVAGRYDLPWLARDQYPRSFRATSSRLDPLGQRLALHQQLLPLRRSAVGWLTVCRFKDAARLGSPAPDHAPPRHSSADRSQEVHRDDNVLSAHALEFGSLGRDLGQDLIRVADVRLEPPFCLTPGCKSRLDALPSRHERHAFQASASELAGLGARMTAPAGVAQSRTGRRPVLRMKPRPVRSELHASDRTRPPLTSRNATRRHLPYTRRMHGGVRWRGSRV
jgi:hypothetical protein